MRFIVASIVLIFMHCATADELQCFTDEPRAYKFDIGAQKVGTFKQVTRHVSGKLAGTTYNFLVTDVAAPSRNWDYLVKRYSKGAPYAVTYAMECKLVK